MIKIDRDTQPPEPRDELGVRRRDLFTSATALAAGLAACAHDKTAAPTGASRPPTSSDADGLPGPYPGKVVEIHHPGSVRDGRIDGALAARMLDEALLGLVGEQDVTAAWRRFVSPGERVGLKVNCVGHPVSDEDRHAVYTSHEIIRAIVARLRTAGIRDILLFDRYRAEFTISGYPDLANELGIPWDVAAVSWDQTQIDMDGYSQNDPFAAEKNAAARGDGSPKVSGYDPEVYLTLDYVHPAHDPRDPRTRRSHVARIVTQKVDKIINLCLVKDHVAAGITGALKNLSHGLVDNVCRSHSRPSLNQTSTFIPAVLAMPIIRKKVVLNVMEGFRGIYHLGPWASRHVFEPRSLFLSTDPVAIDRIAMDVIDARRAEEGLPPLLRAGQISAQGQDEHHLARGTSHVALAGAAGLGIYPRDAAEWKSWLGRAPEDVGRPLPVIEHLRRPLA